MANLVWAALGNPKSYLEPFFGSGAVLLARPNYDPTVHVETVCDLDGWLANVWRGLQYAPDEVAQWCNWPVNHADLSARKRRLLANEARLLENLIADDTWYDARLAGYWIWAASCWIGSGLTRPGQRPHVSDTGMGIHALGKRPDVGDTGKGVLDVRDPYNPNIYVWFRRLSERLRHVRVVCGDWTRVCGGNWQDPKGQTVGIFLDPPYGVETRDTGIYHCDSVTVSRAVEDWALERAGRPGYRIVVAGYDDEHPGLGAAGWQRHSWSANGGYGMTAAGDSQGKANRHRETLWFSPGCETGQGSGQLTLDGLLDVEATP